MARATKAVREGLKALEQDVARWLPRKKEWPAIGARVRLIGAHPWAGEVGMVVGMETLSLLPDDGPRPKVELEVADGRHVFITQADQWEPA